MVYGIIYGLFFPHGKYIGQTIQGINIRWREHLRDVKKGSTLPVHNAIRKYYDTDSSISQVEIKQIAEAHSEDELNELEKKYIIEHNTFNNKNKNPNGYNLTIGGDGCTGYKFTEAQKEVCKQREIRRKIEHPEIALNHSKCMKQLHLNNPSLAKQQSVRLKQLYSDNPSKKEDMSTLKKQQYRDNPDLAKQQSELKNMMYEDKFASNVVAEIRSKSLIQWKDPEKRKKLMDEKRARFTREFDVYKDEILIGRFDYVPDCALKLFGNNKDATNISAVLKGKRKICKGYVFTYK
jgi:hypothetical protein